VVSDVGVVVVVKNGGDDGLIIFQKNESEVQRKELKLTFS